MRNFTEGFIQQVAHEDWDDALYPDLKIIYNKDKGSCGRWTNLHECVFHLEGKHYMFTYEVSGTETSWGSGTFEGNISYDSEDEWTDIVEVVKKEVVKFKWVPVDEKE